MHSNLVNLEKHVRQQTEQKRQGVSLHASRSFSLSLSLSLSLCLSFSLLFGDAAILFKFKIQLASGIFASCYYYDRAKAPKSAGARSWAFRAEQEVLDPRSFAKASLSSLKENPIILTHAIASRSPRTSIRHTPFSWFLLSRLPSARRLKNRNTWRHAKIPHASSRPFARRKRRSVFLSTNEKKTDPSLSRTF